MVMTAKHETLLAEVYAKGGFYPSRPGDVVKLVQLESFGYVAKVDAGRWEITKSGVDALIAKGARA